MPVPGRTCAAVPALAAALAVIAVVAGAARGAARGPLATSAPFTLASGFQQGYGGGESALGPDGTVWLAQPGFGPTPTAGFEIVALGAGGRRLRPVVTSDGAGSVTDRPAIAAGAGGAMFVWQTASGVGGAQGVAQVRARRCTLGGCGPIQVLARWPWNAAEPAGGSGFTALGDAEPGVATAGRNVVAVFMRGVGGAPRIAWAVATGPRFGAVHVLPGPGGLDPVVATVPGGVVAAWIAGPLASYGSGIEWARWSARGGFSRPRALAGVAGLDSGLVATPDGGGVALAWLEGSGVVNPIPAGAAWMARGGSGGFSRPARVFAGAAAALSLAGASGALALGFTTGAHAAGPEAHAPAWVARSEGGRPFGAAVDFDPEAASPAAVAVAAGGDVLAAWNACRGASCAARLALAGGRTRIAAARTLGAEERGDAPAIHTVGRRTLVTWESGDAVRGVIATR
jgi:hypothetical protein